MAKDFVTEDMCYYGRAVENSGPTNKLGQDSIQQLLKIWLHEKKYTIWLLKLRKYIFTLKRPVLYNRWSIIINNKFSLAVSFLSMHKKLLSPSHNQFSVNIFPCSL